MKRAGFPFWKYSLSPPEVMFEHLQNQTITTYDTNGVTVVVRNYPEDYMKCDHLSNHFTESIRITCTFGTYPSPLVIYKSVKNDKEYKAKTPLDKREYIYSLTKECNTFNVSYCYYLYQTLLRDVSAGAKVLYEMEGVTEEVAREAFALGAAKLPIQTIFVSRRVMG